MSTHAIQRHTGLQQFRAYRVDEDSTTYIGTVTASTHSDAYAIACQVYRQRISFVSAY